MKIHLSTPIRRRIAGWTVAATAAVIVAACGSNNNDIASPTTPIVSPPTAASVPLSAVVDIASFISYLNTLAINDTQEPLVTDAVTPPTTETGDPIII